MKVAIMALFIAGTTFQNIFSQKKLPNLGAYSDKRFATSRQADRTNPLFVRTVLAENLNRPWEMLYGPDNMLWITQSGGRVSRIDPNSGNAFSVYMAPDFFSGDASQAELLPCAPANPFQVSSGTYGMALHPDFFMNPFVYFIYSYNSSTTGSPISKYKVRRLLWDTVSKTVSAVDDVITDLPLGLSHEGMRMLIVKEGSVPYIYITCGDGTIDDDRCYPAGNNLNLRAQDWNSKFGKVLRYNIDGSIPLSNPIAGSPVFTNGHRNPLGLAYNSATNKLYLSENGKSTDDEINVIDKSKNYGWPKARGYHTDNNYPGEAAFISNYSPLFSGNDLKEALYSWAPELVTLPEDPQNVSVSNVVAPSDMIYYPPNGLPEFSNCLLVTSLKNSNPNFRASVYVFKLDSSGDRLDSSYPNPQIFFPENDPPTLRYRDITMAPDGKTFFICTDSWDGINNKILKFTLAPPVVYTFVGNGNWSVPSNWIGNHIPPSPLPTNCEIYIDPISECILDVPFFIADAGSKITVKAGKKFIINGNLIVY